MKLRLWHHLRRPMTRQVLGSMIVISILSSVVASAGIGFIWTRQIRSRYHDEIHRVAEILRSSTFPLHRSVLYQVKGLSGMELISLANDGKVIDSTLHVTVEEKPILAALRQAYGVGKSRPQETSVRLAQNNYQALVVPIPGARGSSAPVACVVILQRQTLLARELQQVILPTIVATAVAVLVGLLLSIGIAHHITRPLVDLTEQTIKAAHDLHSDITLPKVDDETVNLAKAIQHLITERRDYEQTMRQEAHLQAAHQFALGLGHQLRNLLTALRMALELHSQHCSLNDDEDLTVAIRQVRLIDSVLRQFLSLRAFSGVQKEPVNYAEIVQSVLDLLKPAFRHTGVAVHADISREPCPVMGHPISLEQLTTNLIMNALEAVQRASAEPKVTVILRRSERGLIRLVVEDNGPGPPPAVEKELFLKPITTKRDGIGLGLFVAQLIARQHNGKITWTRENALTRFVFEFPGS